MTYAARPKKPQLSEDYNPGKARWCEEHGRLECTKNRSKGRGTCHQAAVRGTDACKNHSGYSNAVTKTQGVSRITAWTPEGKTIKLDAGMAVLGVLQMSWLRLASYSRLLHAQVTTDGTKTPDDPAVTDVPEGNGLIGFRYGAAGKDGVIYTQNEEVRALVLLEAAERDRVVKYAKVAHDMGISSRLTDLAEKWGDVVAGRITFLLEALNLTPEQEAQVPLLLESHLGSLDIEGMQAVEGVSSRDQRE